MNKKRLITFAVIFILLISTIGYFALTRKPNQTDNQTPASQPATLVKYENTEYGFNFPLPDSWIGYSIVTEKWTGYLLNTPNAKKIEGPKIVIRHPEWTAENPRQDIPIMIFTPGEWDLIQQEMLSVGAAPVGPSELGHNSNYVFALPARYNYAFPTGYEEVEKNLENKPLQTF